MSESISADPVLARPKREHQALYGARLKQVLLYGSRARGDHMPYSDCDVLVVLEPPFDDRLETKRLCQLSSDPTWDTALTENPVVASFRAVALEEIKARTGFMHNPRNEAIAL